MTRIIIVCVIFLICGYANASMMVWTAPNMAKIKRNATPGSFSPIDLKAAKNEFETAQIIVYANGADVAGVDAVTSDLVGVSGTISAANVRIYREDYLYLNHRSNTEGDAGYWPDPLIPKKDMFYSEARNVFPCTVTNGLNQPIFVEVYVPPTTPAGTYNGSVTVSAIGETPFNVPIQVKVWNFTLPSTSSLSTSYSYSETALAKGFTRGVGSSNQSTLADLTMKLMLMHRISTRPVSWQMVPSYSGTTPNVTVDWTSWDGYWGPYFDGTALNSYGVLPGARVNAWSLLTDNVASHALYGYCDRMIEHFGAKGWSALLYKKFWDEPTTSNYPALHTSIQTSNANMTNPLHKLVTTSYIPEFLGEITLWTPPINFIHKYYDPSARGDRDVVYPPLLAADNKLWWYQSCMSTGCFYEGSPPAYTGWPNYMIDYNGTYHRVMPWMSWFYGIGGELYYNIVEQWDVWNGTDGTAADPWLNYDRFYANGDGRLIYPGRIDRVGGTHPIPVESLRLKNIRDGYEDYEYFVLAQSHGLGPILSAQISKVVNRNNNFSHDPAVMQSARDSLGSLLDTTLYNGSCGSAKGGLFSVPPNTNLCADGSTPLVNGTSAYSWVCPGSGGGSDANCTTTIPAITSPAAGATIFGKTSVTIAVPASITLSKVELYANSVLLGTMTSIPYTFSWDTTAVPNMTYTLTSKAYDLTGKSASSLPTSVTVNNRETVSPTVNSFMIPPVSASLEVPITNLVATDNVAVTGYLITENAAAPSSDAAGWTFPAPNSFTLSSAGVKTLYAWAKDAANNVSASFSGIVATAGAANTDGVVTLNDALLTLDFVLGVNTPTVEQMRRSDVAPINPATHLPQPDGKLDIGDVIVMLRKGVGVSW